MSAIKFVLNVRNRAASERGDHQVTVIAVSDVDAKETYYSKCPRHVVEVLGIQSATVAKFADLDTEGKSWHTADYFVSDAVEDLAFIEEMEPFPANNNPFHYDSYSMGTPLVNRWVAMHGGYDSEESPRPLQHLYLVNTATGRRVRVHLNDNLPPKSLFIAVEEDKDLKGD